MFLQGVVDLNMPAGRPSDYTPELGDIICAEIAIGYSLRTICKSESMPCVKTIFNWFRAFPEFLQQYEKAKEIQADALAEDILDIADDGTNDWMEQHGKNGESIGWQLNGEHVQRSRLRVDARKWIASKLKAKKYGDNAAISVDHKGTIAVFTADLSPTLRFIEEITTTNSHSDVQGLLPN